MVNTRLMSRLFSATNEKDSELTAQVAQDIEEAKANGPVDTEELKFDHVGDGKVAITDKENGEVTIAEKAEDGNYDLYPAEATEQLEGFIHPEGDGVTPGAQEGEADEKAEDHLDVEGIAEIADEKEPAVEAAAEGAEDEEAVCPECGKNPCECGDEEDEKEFSVSTDNTAVLRIFSDQAFMERCFSETLESGEETHVGNLKIEKDPDADNAVIVSDTNTGDSARVTVDDDELTIDECVESKNFNEDVEDEEAEDENQEFEALHVVGVDVDNHDIIDAAEYDEESASDLVARLEEQGVDAVQVFDNPEDARDYAIDLLENLGSDEENIDEPEQAEFSDHTIYVTRYYSNHTVYMDRLFSEACNDIDASQKEIEDAIEGGEEVEVEGEIITPISDEAAIVEDKENGEFTKVTLDGDDMTCEPISEEEAEEEKKFSHIYCDEDETRFFSDTEDFTSYMERLFSGDADEKEIEDAIESGEQIENDDVVITPVDAETAVIEDKENGEFTKAVMDEEKLDVTPISEDEADDLTKDLEVEVKEEDKEEDDEENEEAEDEEKEAPAEEPKAEEDEKKFSDSILDKFFADAVGVAPAAPAPAAPAQAAPVAAPVAAPAEGEAVEAAPAEEPAATVEAIEDKAVAAVQSIQAAAAEAEAAILNAKAAPAENQEADLQEAQFSEKKFSDMNDTLVSWLNGNSLRK